MKQIIDKAEKLGFHKGMVLEDTDYITLCVIQKWLSDEKNITVTVENMFNIDFNYYISGDIYGCANNYEQALKEGIEYALNEL